MGQGGTQQREEGSETACTVAAHLSTPTPVAHLWCLKQLILQRSGKGRGRPLRGLHMGSFEWPSGTRWWRRASGSGGGVGVSSPGPRPGPLRPRSPAPWQPAAGQTAAGCRKPGSTSLARAAAGGWEARDRTSSPFWGVASRRAALLRRAQAAHNSRGPNNLAGAHAALPQSRCCEHRAQRRLASRPAGCERRPPPAHAPLESAGAVQLNRGLPTAC